MHRMFRRIAVVALALAAAEESHAARQNGFSVSVVVAGSVRCEYAARGNSYVEAGRGEAYAVKLTNPYPYRVAAALSVDGLNSIDGRHTDPAEAQKWLIEPYGSVTISGWQVSGSAARSFFFTDEKRSYGAARGETRNLGIIEAVFFREVPRVARRAEQAPARDDVAGGVAGGMLAAPAPQAIESKADASTSGDFAATGMGDRQDHPVIDVALDLEPAPAARIRLRYEFREQLVALGVLPGTGDPLDRRERARGFAAYCPEVR
jgi:hypothetical protein